MADCIVLMGAIIGFRFFASLYRSGIQGLEHQVWLNIANIVLVTFKFVGALLLLHFVTPPVNSLPSASAAPYGPTLAATV